MRLIPSRRQASAMLAAAGALATTLLAQPAAHADELGCPYGYVCFFDANYYTTGQFHDVTSSWQTLTSSRGAQWVLSARPHNGALLHFTNGKTLCVRPNGPAYNLRKDYGIVDKIKIVASDNC